MFNPKYPRGSEWRRWDLHVHTPFSALNNGFGSDFDQYAKLLLERAVEKGIAAIGVTDYFSIEGYKHLRTLFTDGPRLRALVGAEVAAKAQQILLLPNIELRASVIVAGLNGQASRVNFHVIFADDLAPDVIEEHFLRGLKFTAEASPGNPDELWPLTSVNLESLGKKLKDEHAQFQTQSDLYVGMMNAVVAHEDVTRVLEEQMSRFKDRYLFVVPADEDLSKFSWNGQAHLTRKLFIQKSHMIFSGNPGTREFGLGRKHETVQDFVNEFKSRKPCIHGSDAHSYESLFEPAEGRKLWIKADPTFLGLRQLLYEPEWRVHIGDEPPFLSRVSQNATRYMTAVSFERTQQAKQGETWFSGDLHLNHGLIAIIGNKGSGKSALADILALLGDTHVSEHFSFLTKDRFLAPKTMLGDMFRAKVLWLSGQEVSRRLSEAVDRTGPELVKYIPQNYLEAICSELRESREGRFDGELKEVIFSHVSDAERLGKETLAELIEYVTNEKKDRISQLVTQLKNVNTTISALEDQLTDEYRRSLEGQLEQRRAELKAQDEVKPGEVKEPSQDPQEQQAMEVVKQELSELVDQAQRLDGQITAQQEQLREAARQIAATDRLLTRIDNLERQVTAFHAESVDDGNVLSLDIKKLVTLTVNRQPIVDAKTNANERSQSARNLLAAETAGSLANQRGEVSGKTEATRSKLDQPNRVYQEYLHQLANWQKRRNEIEGSAEVAISVRGLEAKLAALSAVPSMIREGKDRRSAHVQEIFRTKEQLLADYRKLYSPVQDFIYRHPVSQQQGALEFSASITVDGIVEGLLGKIHQGRKGSFQGEQEGRDGPALLSYRGAQRAPVNQTCMPCLRE